MDFLGFSEASADLDNKKRNTVLRLLQAVGSLKSEFGAIPSRGWVEVKPAISTFSDHMLISFPLQSLTAELGAEERRFPRYGTF